MGRGRGAFWLYDSPSEEFLEREAQIASSGIMAIHARFLDRLVHGVGSQILQQVEPIAGRELIEEPAKRSARVRASLKPSIILIHMQAIFGFQRSLFPRMQPHTRRFVIQELDACLLESKPDNLQRCRIWRMMPIFEACHRVGADTRMARQIAHTPFQRRPRHPAL